MKNTISVCRTNEAIANDYYKGRYNNTAHTRSQQGIFTTKKGIDTLRRENSTFQYEKRSNQCGVCFTARSVAGTCEC